METVNSARTPDPGCIHRQALAQGSIVIARIDSFRRCPVSNTSLTDLLPPVVFTARDSGSGLEDSLCFFHTSGTDTAGALEPTSTANTLRCSPLSPPASATAPLPVQPTPDRAEALEAEVRGYVELSLSALSGSLTTIPLQESAEQRGSVFADLRGAAGARRGARPAQQHLSRRRGRPLRPPATSGGGPCR
ncbi:hypothetical protein L107_01997 [Cyanobium sp. Copco_Reservoir_LC18]|nr:hypothetical protein L107_01997 [Cyanobium sp. Copco_Reservoir_LC18]